MVTPSAVFKLPLMPVVSGLGVKIFNGVTPIVCPLSRTGGLRYSLASMKKNKRGVRRSVLQLKQERGYSGFQCNAFVYRLVIHFPKALPLGRIVLINCDVHVLLRCNVDFTLLHTDHICAWCAVLVRCLVRVRVPSIPVPAYPATLRLAREDKI